MDEIGEGVALRGVQVFAGGKTGSRRCCGHGDLAILWRSSRVVLFWAPQTVGEFSPSGYPSIPRGNRSCAQDESISAS
ncbi:hypothetical protein [Kibdelosporangium philippinense]|uniref:hypothetical protein n=1 Tax=Kibdelosporangium philippinense TaxID=211113 RepID=UPI00360B01FC